MRCTDGTHHVLRESRAEMGRDPEKWYGGYESRRRLTFSPESLISEPEPSFAWLLSVRFRSWLR